MTDLSLDAQQIQLLGKLVGVTIDVTQAETLVSQAAPHFALMHALDTFDARGAEPAAEFRLQSEERNANA